MRLQSVFSIFLLLSGMNSTPAVKQDSPELLIFQGRVIKRTRDSRAKSGGDSVFSLVKYKVERVCEGEYTDSEIAVDHLMISGKELKGLKVGAVVCLTVAKRKEISTRWNATGIREPSESVNMFYVAQKFTRASCGCAPH